MSTFGRANHLLWAKLPRPGTEGPGPFGYHPLACHMLDTAAVAAELWETAIPPSMRSWMARALDLPEVDAKRWCEFLASVHDVGKASPVFQQRCAALVTPLGASGLPFPSHTGRRILHGTISAVALEPFLSRWRVERSVARTAATVIGGHHGVFPTSYDLSEAKAVPQTIGTGAWAEVRTGLLAKLAETIGVVAGPSALPTPVAMALTGFVSVSDWIASDEDHFPLANSATDPAPIDWAGYLPTAQARAQAAIRDLGWSLTRPEVPRPRFDRLFPDLHSPHGGPPQPNDLQQQVLERDPGATPRILILEAPMGEGKTEAALLAADASPRGFYVALPTQAASDQTFARVSAFLRHRFPGSRIHLQLLHGHASLSEEIRSLRSRPASFFRPSEGDDAPGGEAAPSEVLAAEWFTYRKRGLLAPFGVGTIDQVLLADLATRHVFVRLFGLAHKAVVLDEVHAYDVYMTSLAEGLVEWLGALETSVVLLSATLPRARREALVRAYLKGRGVAGSGTPSASYPRLTWASERGTGSVEVRTSPFNRKTVRIEWIEAALPAAAGDPFPIGEALRVRLKEGGRAAVICNTVRRAQEMYRALRPLFAADEVGLLHAQFPLAARRERETRCLHEFGRDRGPESRRSVLVSTQIIEQSLDLDFDLMVTDFAPADLLIQRSGRLHRHPRTDRPPRLKEPSLFICRPGVGEHGVPRFKDPEHHVFDGWVYDEHALLRSWLSWEGRAQLVVPDDLESMVEAVYADSSPPASLNPALRSRWEETHTAHLRTLNHQEYEAEIRKIGPPCEPTLSEVTPDPREEDAASPELHPALQALTRLTRPSQPVVLLGPEWDARAGWADERSPPSYDTTAALLEQSLTLTDVAAVQALWEATDSDTPKVWKQSPLLRGYRLLRLDEKGKAGIPTRYPPQYWVRLDADLGLQVGSS